VEGSLAEAGNKAFGGLFRSLCRCGMEHVFVLDLAADELHESEAAVRLGAALCGNGVAPSGSGVVGVRLDRGAEETESSLQGEITAKDASRTESRSNTLLQFITSPQGIPSRLLLS
jgi:hypothetical protein